MSESTICPYCNAKLRLATSKRRPARVKCRICKNRFHPSQVLTVGGSASLNEPLSTVHDGAGDDEVAAHPATAKSSEPVDEMPPPTEDSIDPEVMKAAFPEEVSARHEARGHAERERERVKERFGRQRRHKLSAFKIGLAASLLMIGCIGLAGAAWYFLKPALPAINPVEVADAPDNQDKIVSILAKDFAIKPLPKRLVGIWELRSDDEHSGWIEFRSDNTMYSKAWRGGRELNPSQANWYLVGEVGDDLQLEIGPQRGHLGNPRYLITLTGPDAFTLTHIIENGIRHPEDRRFTRSTANASPNP